MTTNGNRFCAAFPRTPGVPGKMAMLNAKKWEPGTVLGIRFLSGSTTLQDRVVNAANMWLQFANLAFDFRDTGSATIRIDFMEGKGSWSYIGTDALSFTDQATPTMNYGWLNDETPDEEVRRVVLHEFGHAIGMIHEHLSPLHPVQWNREQVIKDLSGPPNNWDLQTIENNMFARIPPEDVSGTSTDPTSIMMYPIPTSWTLDGTTAGMNISLSETDKDFVRQAYPF